MSPLLSSQCILYMHTCEAQWWTMNTGLFVSSSSSRCFLWPWPHQSTWERCGCHLQGGCRHCYSLNQCLSHKLSHDSFLYRRSFLCHVTGIPFESPSLPVSGAHSVLDGPSSAAGDGPTVFKFIFQFLRQCLAQGWSCAFNKGTSGLFVVFQTGLYLWLWRRSK